MSDFLSQNEVLEQSQQALDQWKPRWKKHAMINGQMMREKGRSHDELTMAGVGRTVVEVGLGASLEAAVPLIKEHRELWDVSCVDKAFSYLLQHGIKPDQVVVADAMVSYEKYAKPFIKDSEGVRLLMNVTANPKWAKHWKGPIYFFVNKDNLRTEVDFGTLSGCKQAIPAASNVGNCQVTFNHLILSYDRHLLVGYDFCWDLTGNYYADQWEDRKRAYMFHRLVNGPRGVVATSNNLHFSARWLTGFMESCRQQGAPIDMRDCSSGIMECRKSDLTTEANLIALRGAHRPWTLAEKQEYLRGHRQKLVLSVQDFPKIDELLKDQNMVTLNVTLSGVPRPIAERVGLLTTGG